jgi:hypothetical protein
MKHCIVYFLFPFLAYAQNQKGASPIANAQERIAKNTYAVVVGISDYQDKDIPDLRFADRDAEAFANFLRSQAGGSLDGDHLKLLTNSEATLGQFAAALDWLMEVTKEGDNAIVYFSGHGDVEKKDPHPARLPALLGRPFQGVHGRGCLRPEHAAGGDFHPIHPEQGEGGGHHRRLPLRYAGG